MSSERRGAFFHNGEGHGRPVSEMEPLHKTSLEQTLLWLHMQYDGNTIEPGQVTRHQIERAIHGQNHHLDSSTAYHQNERSHPSVEQRNQTPEGRNGASQKNHAKRR